MDSYYQSPTGSPPSPTSSSRLFSPVSPRSATSAIQRQRSGAALSPIQEELEMVRSQLRQKELERDKLTKKRMEERQKNTALWREKQALDAKILDLEMKALGYTEENARLEDDLTKWQESETELSVELEDATRQLRVALRRLEDPPAPRASIYEPAQPEPRLERGAIHETSEADIIQHLATLNQEIAQVTSQIVTSTQFDQRHVTVKAPELVPFVDQLKEELKLGDSIKYLPNLRHDENHTLVQIVLRACTLAILAPLFQSWDIDHNEDINQALATTYSRISTADGPDVGSLWRLLVRSYIDDPQTEASKVAEYEQSLARHYSTVLFLAAAHEKPDEHLQQFADAISHLVQLGMNLRKAIGRQGTTCDYAVYLPLNPEPFVEERMSAVQGTEPVHEDVVLCPVQYGLLRLDGDDARTGSLLVKSEVAVLSFAEGMVKTHKRAWGKEKDNKEKEKEEKEKAEKEKAEKEKAEKERLEKEKTRNANSKWSVH
ncbi:hypothetical protein K474DRAFT_1696548 [Panus rudis PR-1116 ss-1]|nr:hypothetical protein K474DRAFT_1696548 [Panus rudis PR-1116 ss-1]